MSHLFHLTAKAANHHVAIITDSLISMYGWYKTGGRLQSSSLPFFKPGHVKEDNEPPKGLVSPYNEQLSSKAGKATETHILKATSQAKPGQKLGVDILSEKEDYYRCLQRVIHVLNSIHKSGEATDGRSSKKRTFLRRRLLALTGGEPDGQKSLVLERQRRGTAVMV